MKRTEQTVLLAIMGVAAGGLLGYNQCYRPQVQKAERIQRQIEQERANQALAGEVAGLFQHVEQYRQRLPKEPDPSWLVQRAIALAQDAGVLLTRITPKVPEEDSQYARLSVRLEFRASYHHLGAFLDRIENDASFFLIEQLDIANPTEQDHQAPIQMTLSTLHVPAIR